MTDPQPWKLGQAALQEIPVADSEKTEISPAELQAIRTDFSKRFLGKRPDEEEMHRHVEAKIRDLLEMKERFDHVFKTEKGSIYFTLSTGPSFRIKQRDTDEMSRLQPVLPKIVFVDASEIAILSQWCKESPNLSHDIFGKQIATVPFALGTHPVELTVIGYGPDTQPILEEADGTITLLGIQKVSPTGELSEVPLRYSLGSIHLGNKIVEVIK